MKLYVIRHGQTNWNLKGIIQGQKDIELNDKENLLKSNENGRIRKWQD